MRTYERILRKLQHIYWDSTDPVCLLTTLMYPAAGYGLARAFAANAEDTHWMFGIASAMPDYCHALGWGLLIAYVWVARIVGLFFWAGNRWTRCTTPLLGLSFWAALLASNIADSEHLAFGLLYTVAAAMEMWILSRAWQEK